LKEFDFSGIDEKAAIHKYEKLIVIIKRCVSALAAFSGGVDSSFLAAAAKEALGDNVTLATAVSETFPKHELETATAFAKKMKIRQIFVESSELDIKEFRANPKNRCYYCKKELFKKFLEIAAQNNIKYVFSGANHDDIGDFRPGLSAQGELGIISPLMDAGLTKMEIRFLSKKMGLDSWNRPQMACLTSRFPYGVEFTPEKFSAVESCEDFLRELGLSQYRVRVHGELARIEIEPDEFAIALDKRKEIAQEFKRNGFKFITIDIEGFRTGSFND